MKEYETLSGKTIVAEIKNAVGVEGFLLYDFKHFWFRVYDDDYNFKDYKIHHNDMKIKIIDNDARFYETEDGETYIDYSPLASGYKEEE